MGVVHFTVREMNRAWKNNLQAFKQSSKNMSNAHRLLLFYAVECGLKVALMKRKRATCTKDCEKEIIDAQHDINKLLDHLKAGVQYKLPRSSYMTSVRINGQDIPRAIASGQINQMWRYGGKLDPRNSKNNCKNDAEIEKALLRICDWIDKELG